MLLHFVQFFSFSGGHGALFASNKQSQVTFFREMTQYFECDKIGVFWVTLTACARKSTVQMEGNAQIAVFCNLRR